MEGNSAKQIKKKQRAEKSRFTNSLWLSFFLHALILLLFLVVFPAEDERNNQTIKIQVELAGAASYKSAVKSLAVKRAAPAKQAKSKTQTQEVQSATKSAIKVTQEKQPVPQKPPAPVLANSQTLERKKLVFSKTKTQTRKQSLSSDKQQPAKSESSDIAIEKLEISNKRTSQLQKKLLSAGAGSPASSAEASSKASSKSSLAGKQSTVASSKTSSRSAASSFDDVEDSSPADTGQDNSLFRWKKQGSASRQLISRNVLPIPKNLQGQGIRSQATVLFRIDKTGKPFAIEVLRSSKYEELDVWILQLVRSFRFNRIENNAVYEAEYLQFFQP